MHNDWDQINALVRELSPAKKAMFKHTLSKLTGGPCGPLDGTLDQRYEAYFAVNLCEILA